MPAQYPTQISPNRRYLLTPNNTPFFYLADTAWELFHRLNRDETDLYLQTRAAQGFTVIQAVVLAELDGLNEPNRQGDRPLHDNDPTRPNEAYFAHVDWVIQRADELGLCIGLLPTWGDKWNQKWGVGPEIFTPENAAIYGEWLGKRYADALLIWIVGGDRPIENETHRAIVQNMALGLKRGDGGHHLITFHPCGQQTSSHYFHTADWLDFNMWQTGHERDRDNYNSIAADYALTPAKPCLDSEPGYEDHPAGFKPENGYLNDYDTRRSLYWALLSGACGHAYGCHDIWQFWEPSRAPITAARTPWREALNFPGAQQMHHARTLLESRSFTSLIPDQLLITSPNPNGPHHIRAMRDENGDYALIYFAAETTVTIDLIQMSSPSVYVTWLNPRNGEMRVVAEYPTDRQQNFKPPTTGPNHDWVLILEKAL